MGPSWYLVTRSQLDRIELNEPEVIVDGVPAFWASAATFLAMVRNPCERDQELKVRPADLNEQDMARAAFASRNREIREMESLFS